MHKNIALVLVICCLIFSGIVRGSDEKKGVQYIKRSALNLGALALLMDNEPVVENGITAYYYENEGVQTMLAKGPKKTTINVNTQIDETVDNIYFFKKNFKNAEIEVREIASYRTISVVIPTEKFMKNYKKWRQEMLDNFAKK